ncbi:MAG: Peptidase [Firmicutes bacterium]|nr:Peptidase [Bacillota bacterium]
MSKLRLAILHFAPLCLKLRGRIVGAVSRMTMTIYIASGLLLISSMVLVIVFFGMKSDLNTVVRSEKGIENQVAKPVEDRPAAITVLPQAVSERVPKTIEKEPSKDVLATSKIIRGPIKVDFGWQLHEVYKDWRYHTGIDISGATLDSVEAINNGQVTDIFQDDHSGLTVVIKNDTYSVYYGSLSEVKVDKGNYISVGQTIGRMGSCDAEPYNHLHLGIKKGEQYIDPKLIINQE